VQTLIGFFPERFGLKNQDLSYCEIEPQSSYLFRIKPPSNIGIRFILKW
jgi:hypothetical protein